LSNRAAPLPCDRRWPPALFICHLRCERPRPLRRAALSDAVDQRDLCASRR
jgi:hypothetical protein